MRGGMDAGVHRPASGPFIGRTFTYAPATRTDVVATSAVFVLCMGLAFFATKTGLNQTKWSRRPWKSLYFRLLWLTLAVTVSHAILFLLCMLDIVRLSVYSLLLILIGWFLQVQLLLQIIVNRIQIVMSDKNKETWLMNGVAYLVTFINVVLLGVGMPAHLQVSQELFRMSPRWFCTEKICYMIIDIALNYYFIHLVSNNLIQNGLSKYDKLVQYNRLIILVLLAIDGLLPVAVRIENVFLQGIVHPFAYLVKLNLEMSVAHVFRSVALDKSTSNTTFQYRSIPNDQNQVVDGIGKISSTNKSISVQNTKHLKDTSSRAPAGVQRCDTANSNADRELVEVSTSEGGNIMETRDPLNGSSDFSKMIQKPAPALIRTIS